MNRAFDLYNLIKEKKETAIDELIETRQSEELFLDFKRSGDNGEGKHLHQSDRDNLAKAISGFANSDGGVIIWGIECSDKSGQGDLPSAKHYIKDVKKFKSKVESVISGLTLPAHNKIENLTISINAKDDGLVVTYIPAFTTNPIQAIHTKHFYVRAGSSFMPAPYQVLAGMFGRKPQPRVYHMYTIGPAILENQTIKTHTGLLINNEGPGIAKDVFINANIYSSPGPNCEIGFETPDLKDWSGGFSFGRFLYLISKNDVRIPPEAHLQPVIIRANFTPPYDKDLIIEITAGCEGAPPMKGKLYSTKKNIEEVYAKYVSSQIKWKDDIPHNVAQEILGKDKDE